MAETRQIYKCEVCGNIVEVLHGADGALVCCNQEMVLLDANTVDAAQEKHVPVIEQDGNIVTVKVGSEPHPMQEEHYIEFIELLTDARLYRVFLDPGKKPEASFDIHGKVLAAREYCNKHGLWEKKL